MMKKALMWQFLLASVMGFGCSSGTADRRDLKGRVTYEGQPVATGTIFFNPDPAKGGTGPQGSGEIHDGRYQTNKGFGAVSGPHIVRISGFDNKPSDDPNAAMLPGRPLFQNYEVFIDIDKNQATLDFEVPLQVKK